VADALLAALSAIGAAGVTAAGAVVVAMIQRERRAARAEKERETALPPAPPSAPIRTHNDATLEALEGRVLALERNDMKAARLYGRLEIELARLQGGQGGRDSEA
jgi:hypothetical protein